MIYDFAKKWFKAGSTVWIYHNPDSFKSEDEIKRINSCVGKNDTIIILGDVGDIEYVRRVRGYKVLVMGTYECYRKLYEKQKVGYKVARDSASRAEVLASAHQKYPNWNIKEISEGYDLLHSPFVYWWVDADNGLFDEIYEGPVMISEKILLSNEPIDVPWAYNINAETANGGPINLNRLLKTGVLKSTKTIHRIAIEERINK